MPTQALAPTTAAGTSSDIAVTSPNKTVALYRAIDDGLELEGPATDALLLESGDKFLLEQQAGDVVDIHDKFPILLKDPNGAYNPTHLSLRSYRMFQELGPGTWQVQKPETAAAVGIQYD